MNTIENYAKQASKPKWYEVNDNHIYLSATSGSSPFNEWYEFKDRKEAVNFLHHMGQDHQRYGDEFELLFVDGESEVYSIHECTFNDEECNYIPNEDAEPANLSDMVWAQSRF